MNMGFIIGFFIFLGVVSVILNLVGSSLSLAFSLLRPYMAFLLIAGLIAVLGMVVDIIFSGAQDVFFFIAKVVAVLVGAALCLHLIYMIGKRFL